MKFASRATFSCATSVLAAEGEPVHAPAGSSWARCSSAAKDAATGSKETISPAVPGRPELVAEAAAVRADVEHAVSTRARCSTARRSAACAACSTPSGFARSRGTIAVDRVAARFEQPLREGLHANTTRSSSSRTGSLGGELAREVRARGEDGVEVVEAEQRGMRGAGRPARVAARVAAQRQPGGVQRGVGERLGRQDRPPVVARPALRRVTTSTARRESVSQSPPRRTGTPGPRWRTPSSVPHGISRSASSGRAAATARRSARPGGRTWR